MAMDEVETLTDFARRFGRHNEDYGTDIRDAGTPDFIGSAASSRNLPYLEHIITAFGFGFGE
jgi:hypothetical protein